MDVEPNEQDRAYASRRKSESLWYAWGWQDATGDSFDEWLFAEYCHGEALDYRCERRSSLSSIQDQFRAWKALQPA